MSITVLFAAMNTFKDKQHLEDPYETGPPPRKLWNGVAPRMWLGDANLGHKPPGDNLSGGSLLGEYSVLDKLSLVPMNADIKCRFCGGPLAGFLDLGMSPLCESFLSKDQLNLMQPFYPLAASVCRNCFLVQLQEYVSPEQIFSEYAYFSSYSDAWLDHVRRYAETITRRLSLGPTSRVIELGSNDGYLLQFFMGKGIPVLGIDPAANVAAVAQARGVPTIVTFFGVEVARKLAEEGIQADFVVGNNVLAQVANLNSFVEGLSVILKSNGACTIEFPHLLKTMLGNQFDQIYHEHFS
jgi:hypothetical protein